jgi:hypothetical protein
VTERPGVLVTRWQIRHNAYCLYRVAIVHQPRLESRPSRDVSRVGRTILKGWSVIAGGTLDPVTFREQFEAFIDEVLIDDHEMLTVDQVADLCSRVREYLAEHDVPTAFQVQLAEMFIRPFLTMTAMAIAGALEREPRTDGR